jgi:F-type H+-transporting ATPase subunit gamma
METVESLKKKIKSTNDLLGVVKTMKALAAVSIRQFQRAVESLTDYRETVEMGLEIVLKSQVEEPAGKQRRPKSVGAVIFGSDQGLCGQLNTLISSYSTYELHMKNLNPDEINVITIGERARDYLEMADLEVAESIPTPSSISGITPAVQELVMIIYDWHFNQRVEQIYLFFNKYISGANYRQDNLRILPVDGEWLKSIKKRKWDSKTLPLFTVDKGIMFHSLIREYLFVSLYSAFAESLASENASRLAAMQSAEKNIEERLNELNLGYFRQRQSKITEELLDVVAGYEVLKNE